MLSRESNTPVIPSALPEKFLKEIDAHLEHRKKMVEMTIPLPDATAQPKSDEIEEEIEIEIVDDGRDIELSSDSEADEEINKVFPLLDEQDGISALEESAEFPAEKAASDEGSEVEYADDFEPVEEETEYEDDFEPFEEESTAAEHARMEIGINDGETVHIFQDDTSSDEEDEEDDLLSMMDTMLTAEKERRAVAEDKLQAALMLLALVNQQLVIASADLKAKDERIRMMVLLAKIQVTFVNELEAQIIRGKELLTTADKTITDLSERNEELETVVESQQAELANMDALAATQISPARSGMFKPRRVVIDLDETAEMTPTNSARSR